MTPTPPVVRDGTAGDLANVFAIADGWKGGKSKPYYQGEDQRAVIRAAIEKGVKRLLIAEQEERVVGFGVYEMEGAVAFIKLVMTSRDHMHRGVASALIRAVVARHEQVAAYNDVEAEMKEMYEQLGFRCTDKFQPGPYKNWVFSR